MKRYLSDHRLLLPLTVIGFWLTFIGVEVLFPLRSAHAFPVPPLPDNNLISNPWFRSASEPHRPGLDEWTDAAGLDQYWSSSQKESNPSPDIVVSIACNYESVYCGTSARLSLTPGQSGGIGLPGVDSYLYQVVPADPTHTTLKFFTHWVSHRIDPAEINIYGGNSENGPWTHLWTPLYHVQDTNPPPPPGGAAALWTFTDFLEQELTAGYPYYKVEIHARLPEGPEAVGFKITGVYFATETGSPEPPETLDFFVHIPIIQRSPTHSGP